MTIKIDGKFVEFFTAGSINLKLDSIASTFEFAARFNAQNLEHQVMLKPLQYKDVEIFNAKNKLIFTGTILNHRFRSNKGRELVIISGYSKCGILEDVTIPVSAYPLESTNRSLEDIATKLCNLYGIKLAISDQSKSISDTALIFDKRNSDKSTFKHLKSKVKAIFGRTVASPTESIKDYLAKLAGQKNIILSHNEKGEVLLFQPDYDQKPKYFFTKGNSLSMSADFNGQALHSEINIIRQPTDDNEGISISDKVVNPLVNKYRATTKVLTCGEESDTTYAAKNELASELKAITLNVELQGLFDEIYPGEIVNVHNHYIYCYAYNRFMVESITLKFNEKEDATSLNLLVPEAFTGGPLIRNILFNHLDEDDHTNVHLNEYKNEYLNDKTIL